MRRVRGEFALLAVLWVGSVAAAQDAGVAPEEPPVFVVTALEANAAAADVAPALTQQLSARISDARFKVFSAADIAAALGAERQRQLLGCADGTSCLTEVSGALGARYVVSGRVDRLGERYLLSVNLFDSKRTLVIAKPTRDTTDAGLLVQGVDEICDELLAPFGIPPRVGVRLVDRLDPMGVNLGLKLGTQLVTGLVKFQLGGDLEVAYRLSLKWAIFLQLSFGVQFGASTTVAFAPGLLGLRRYFRVEHDLQPFVSAGLGVLTTIDALQGKTRPSLVFGLGLQYLVSQHFGVTLEGNVDVLGLLFGIGESGTIKTVNLGIALGIVYRF